MAMVHMFTQKMYGGPEEQDKLTVFQINFKT
jgi:hypothetical protein